MLVCESRGVGERGSQVRLLQKKAKVPELIFL